MTKKTRKKLSKKHSQRIKTLVLATGLLICCCIVINLLFTINILKKPIYKLDSRVKEVEKEKKKDKKDLGYETIAWLKVQGTNIDTPIIGYEAATALENVDKENYLWNGINEEKFFNQVAISGHNILNLSAKPLIGKEYFTRFDDLMAFAYDDFVEENKYIQYTVDGEDYIYKIFGVFFEKDYNLDLKHEGNYTDEEMKKYLEQIEELNIYDFDVEVDESDDIITLTTCTRIYGKLNKKQFVVVGRKLREKEKMYNYEVTPNENYKEIEEKLKGDESNAKA